MAKTVGPDEFFRLLTAKGIELGLFREEIRRTPSKGSVTYHYEIPK